MKLQPTKRARLIKSAGALTVATSERLSWRIHPLIKYFNDKFVWPPRLGDVLRTFSLAHTICISSDVYCVDGFAFETSLPQSEQLAVARRTINGLCPFKMFASKFDSLHGQVNLSYVTINYLDNEEIGAGLLFEYEPYDNCPVKINTLIPRVALFYPRYRYFAVEPVERQVGDVKISVIPEKPTIVLAENNSLVLDDFALDVSQQFINMPSEKNATYLGDLFLLSQARRQWKVTHLIQDKFTTTRFSAPLFVQAYMAAFGEQLHKTIGYESFKNHAAIETLTKTPQELAILSLLTKKV